MSAPQTYTINLTQPISIFPSGQSEAVTVMNTETTRTVLLADLPGNSGFPLSPGSTITWDQGKALYAWVEDTTLPVKLVVLDNGGSITNAGAIAQQIIAGGLADQIAASIVASALAGNIGKAAPVPPSATAIGTAVGTAVPVPPTATAIGVAVGTAVPVPPSATAIGTAVGTAVPVPPSATAIGTAVGTAVPVPPSATAIGTAVGTSALPTNTANAINAQGVPSVDKPVVIWAGDANTGNAFYDISRYQSLHIRVDGQGFTSLATQVMVNVSTIATAPNPIGQITMQDEYFTMFGNSSMQIVMPAIGDKIVVNVMANQVGVSVGMANVTILGSYRSVQSTTSFIDSIRWGTSTGTSIYGGNTTRTVGIGGSLAAGALINDYPPFRPGPATLNIRTTSALTAGNIILGLRNFADGLFLGGRNIVPADGVVIQQIPITLPQQPFYITMTAGSTMAPTQSVYTSITY